MMLAANYDLDLLKLIAFAAIGVVAWWQQRKAKKDDEELTKRVRDNERAAGQPSSARPIPPPTNETPEQEKLRRFLEALGVPSNQPAPAPQPAPPVRPLTPSSTPNRPVQRENRPPKQPKQPKQPKPSREPKPAPRPTFLDPEPLPRESIDATPLRGAEVDVATAARFVDNSLPISVASPVPLTSGRPTSSNLNALQQALRSPESLRTAFLVREVLGPPKSVEA